MFRIKICGVTKTHDALAAFEKARDAQIKRGFRVMFSQGQDGPYG